MPPWGWMINFEGERNQTLWVVQGGPVRIRQCQFWSRRVGYGGDPPRLVMLVAAAVYATPVATFSSSSCGIFGYTCSASVYCFHSGGRFSSFPQMIHLRPYRCFICLLLPLRRIPLPTLRFSCCWVLDGLFAWRLTRVACLQTRASQSLSPKTFPQSL